MGFEEFAKSRTETKKKKSTSFENFARNYVKNPQKTSVSQPKTSTPQNSNKNATPNTSTTVNNNKTAQKLPVLQNLPGLKQEEEPKVMPKVLSSEGRAEWEKQNAPTTYQKAAKDYVSNINKTKKQIDKNTVNDVAISKNYTDDELVDIRWKAAENEYKTLDDDTLGLLDAVADVQDYEDRSILSAFTQMINRGSVGSTVAAGSDALETAKAKDRAKTAKEALKQQGYSDEDIEALTEYRRQQRNAKKSADMSEVIKKETEEHPVAGSVFSVVSNVASPMGYVETARAKVKNVPIDPNSIYFAPTQITSDIREEVQSNYDWNIDLNKDGKPWDAFDFVYGAGMSTADSLVAGAMMPSLGLTTNSANWAVKALTRTANSMLGGSLIGAQAMTSTIQDVTRRGGTTEEAINAGVVSFLAETLSEAWSIGNFKGLQESGKRGLLNLAKDLIKSSGVNASEEAITEAVNIVYDRYALGDKSNFELNVQAYMQTPKADGSYYTREEAEQLAWKDSLKQIGEAAASGAFQGVLMGGTANVTGRVSNYAKDSKVGKGLRQEGMTDAVVEAARTSEDKTVQEYVQKINKKGKENASNADIGSVARELMKGGKTTESALETIGSYTRPKTLTSAETVQITHPTLSKADGKVVSLSSVESVKDGKITVKNSEGATQTLDVNKLDGKAKELWSYASEHFNDAQAVETFVRSYDGQNIDIYSRNYKAVFDLASVGMTAQQIVKEDIFEYRTLGKKAFDSAVESGHQTMTYKQGVVDLTTQSKSNSQKLVMRMADEFGKRHGMNITFVDTLGSREGFFTPNKNQIVIALDSSKGAISRTLGHETYHYVEAESPQQAKEISDFVIDSLTRIKGEKWVNDMYSFYEKEGYKTLDEQKSELVADQMFEVFANERAVNEFVAKDRTFAQKVLDHIKGLIAEIKNIYKKLVASGNYEDIAAWQEDLDALQKVNDIMLDALSNIEQRKNTGQKAEKNTSDEVSMSTKRNPAQSKYENDVDAVINGTYNSRSALIMGVTPKIYQDLGFSKLPIAITKNHVYSIAVTEQQAKSDGRYNKKVNYHGLGVQAVKEIYQNISDPIMVIASPDFQSKTQRESVHKVIAIVDLQVGGKQVIAPIEIDAEVTNGKQIIDVNLVSSYFDKSNLEKMLSEAVAQESTGDVGLYYVDKNRAKSIFKLAKVQYLGKLDSLNSNGIIHKIDEKVNRKIDSVLKSQQFVRWFGDWQNHPESASKIVNADGTPKVMYHGTPNHFTEFDKKKAKSSGYYGRGFYFTDSESHSSHYGDAMAVYLDVKNPLEQGKNHISKKQLRNFLEAVAENEDDYDIWNYGTENIDEIIGNIYKDDAFAVIQDVNATAIGDLAEAIDLFNAVNKTNYDGVITPTEVVVYKPTQIKSATDNIGTFDKENPDIRFSTKRPVEETKDLIAVHNMQESELLKTLQLGGFPMPSIAIIKAQQGHSEYGPVSVVFNKSTIDPKKNKNNKVYGGDAWTPTYPTIEYKVNDKVQEKISNLYYELYRKYGADEARPLYNYVNDMERQLNTNRGEAGMIENLKDDERLMQLYLLQSGKGKVEPVIKRTVTELSEEEVEMYDYLISAIGKDVISEFKTPPGKMPLQYRTEFYEKNGEKIENAYKQMLRDNFGFTDEQLDNVISNMRKGDFVKLIRQTYQYMANGKTTTKEETDSKATSEAIRNAIKDSGFNQWVDDLFKGVEEKSGIRNNADYFTSSGNRRSWEALHWENTLENVVKVMKSQNNGVAAFFSGHAIWGVSAKDYKSIEEIKADSDRLKAIPQEEYDAIKEGFGMRLNEIATSIMDKSESNQFIAADNAMQCIVEAVRNSKTKSGILNELRQYRQLDVTETAVDDIVSLVSDISNMPTEYFEAKPQRAVGLDEIAYVVVPDTSTELVNTLNERGIETRTYISGDEADRVKALNSDESVLFSTKRDADYMTAVENGDMETAQKMVDEAAESWSNGNRLYTTDDETGEILFEFYRSADGGRTIWNGHGNNQAQGVFLTSNKYIANAFDPDGKHVTVYAKAENPFEIDANDEIYTAIPVDEDNAPEWLSDIVSYDAVWSDQENEYVTETTVDIDNLYPAAFVQGYDAVIVKNVKEGVGGGTATDVVLKDGGLQMKSADPVTYDDDGNIIPLSQRFDKSKDDIRFATSRLTNYSPLSYNDRAKPNPRSSINWVYEAELFSVVENKLFHQKISEINQGSKAFKKNADGEYMLPIENKIVFTDGDYGYPEITKIIELMSESQTEVFEARRVIYSVEERQSDFKASLQTLENLFGQGFVYEYHSGDNRPYEWKGRTPKGRNRKAIIKRYLKMQNGAGNASQSQTNQGVIPSTKREIGYGKLTQERINELISDSGAGSRVDYARSWIAEISPSAFIDLTIPFEQRLEDREYFDEKVQGDHGNIMGDRDYIEDLKNSRMMPRLSVDFDTGKVIGHDGRHRMRALEIAGASKTPIEIVFYKDGVMYKGNNNGDRLESIEFKRLTSQFDEESYRQYKAYINYVIPLNEDHRVEIERAYKIKPFDEKYGNAIAYSTKREMSVSEDASDYILDTKEYQDILKIVDQRYNLTNKKNLSPKAVESLAGKLLSNSKSKYDKGALTERLSALFDYMANSNELVWEDVMKTAAEISHDILSQSSSLDRSMQNQYKDTLDYLKGLTVYISPEVRAEIDSRYGSLENYRRMLGGKTKITVTDSSKMSLDSLWKELNEYHPEMFDADVSSLDQAEELMNFFDMTKPTYVNQFEYYWDMNEASYDFALQIYEEYFNIPEVVTESQRHKLEMERLKGKQNAKIAQIRNEYKDRIKRIRAEKNSKIEATKELYRERNRQYREKRNDTAERQKLRRQIVRETKKLTDKLVNPTDQKHIPQELIVGINSFAKAMTEHGAFPAQRAAKLQQAFKNIGEKATDPDFNIASMYDEEIEAMLDNLTSVLSNKRLGEMTSAELTQVRDIARYFSHIVSMSNQAFSDGIKEKLSELQTSTFDEAASQSKDKKRMMFKMQTGLLKPVTFFEILESPTLEKLYTNIRKGEESWARTVLNAKQKRIDAQEKHGYKNWADDKVDITTERGDKLSISVKEALSIYATSKRNQGVEHIMKGGIVLEEEARKQLEKKNRFKKNKDKSVNVRSANIPLSLADIQNINSLLTDEQKAYADELVRYMSSDMAKLGNEVSMKLYGIQKYNEDYYFPLKSASNFLYSEPGVENDSRIKHMSMTKRTVPKANNPVVIGDFTETAMSHCNDMALYYGFTLPLEDFKRVWNYKTPTIEGTTPSSIKQQIDMVYGDKANKYIKQMLTDINGGVTKQAGADVVNKMISLIKKNSVFASLSVAVQQPSAIARALAYVDSKYFVGVQKKGTWEEIKKYAPVAVIKEMGYFDTGIGRQAVDWMTETEYEGLKEKAKAFFMDSDFRDDLLSFLPSFMDEISWGRIWVAVKNETKAKHPDLDVKSEEFLNKVGERFTYVIDRTQVYDSVFSRSEWMRSKDTGVKVATAFMSEPLTNYNLIYNAIIKGKSGDKKFVTKALSAYVVSVVFNSILKSFVTSVRDDDKEKSYWEKYIANVISNITDEPFGMIPYFNDVISLIQGYGSDRMDTQILADSVDALSTIFNSEKSIQEKVKVFVNTLGLAIGVPFKNLNRDAVALYNGAQRILKGDYESTTGKGIKYAVAEKYDSSKFKIYKSPNLGKQVVEAYLEGDTAHYNKQYNNMLEKYGGDESKVASQIKTALKEQYTDGKISYDEAKSVLINLCGESSSDAYWKLDEWDTPLEEGETYSKYDDFYDAVSQGNVSSVARIYKQQGVSKETLSGRITSEFKEEYVMLYKTNPAKAKTLKQKLLNAYVAIGYDREEKSKDIDRWVK